MFNFSQDRNRVIHKIKGYLLGKKTFPHASNCFNIKREEMIQGKKFRSIFCLVMLQILYGLHIKKRFFPTLAEKGRMRA